MIIFCKLEFHFFSSNSYMILDFKYNFDHWYLLQAPLKLKLLTPDSRISSKEYNEVVEKGEPHILIDVRPSHHYKIVSLPNSLNVPLASLEGQLPEISSALDSVKENRVPIQPSYCLNGLLDAWCWLWPEISSAWWSSLLNN